MLIKQKIRRSAKGCYIQYERLRHSPKQFTLWDITIIILYVKGLWSGVLKKTNSGHLFLWQKIPIGKCKKIKKDIYIVYTIISYIKLFHPSHSCINVIPSLSSLCPSFWEYYQLFLKLLGKCTCWHDNRGSLMFKDTDCLISFVE